MLKFSVNKNDIFDVLSKVQGLTGRKSNLIITENVLIRASENGIVFNATDLESGFEGWQLPSDRIWFPSRTPFPPRTLYQW